MQLVDHDEFLTRLTTLFEATKTKGSVWLRCKRLTNKDGNADATDPLTEHQEHSCLLKAGSGSATSKFSTKIHAGELSKFHSKYGTLLKAAMGTLRKRDKKRERQKAEESTRRKQRLVEPIRIEGAKRGRGRRKRQRILKAVKRQQQSVMRTEVREKERARKELVNVT